MKGLCDSFVCSSLVFPFGPLISRFVQVLEEFIRRLILLTKGFTIFKRFRHFLYFIHKQHLFPLVSLLLYFWILILLISASVLCFLSSYFSFIYLISEDLENCSLERLPAFEELRFMVLAILKGLLMFRILDCWISYLGSSVRFASQEWIIWFLVLHLSFAHFLSLNFLALILCFSFYWYYLHFRNNALFRILSWK